MKSVTLKIHIMMILLVCSLSINLKANLETKQIVIGSDIRNGLYGPTVVTKMPDSYMATRTDFPLISAPQEYVSFSNSNTSNQANPYQYKKSPELVGNRLVFEGKEPVTLLKETPAQLGYRTNSLAINTQNRYTGEREQHVLNTQEPIFGNVQSIHTMNAETKLPMNLDFQRFEKETTTLTPNRDLHFNQ